VNIALDATRGRRNIGYCPQHDALLEPLTPREHLFLYAGIKGVVKSDLVAHVDALLAKLGLTVFADRPAGQLSGGNKRKLSVAVSLIGSPPLVFLDEPSCGMDPVARRFLWGVLRDVGSQAALLVTTHSMEEAEALSTRLVIMSFGEVVSVGSTTQITAQYGGALEVNLRIRRPAESEVHAAARALEISDLEELLSAGAAADIVSRRGRDVDPAFAGTEVVARALATWWASQDLGASVLEQLERVLPGVEVQEKSGSLWWLRVPVKDGMSKPLAELEQLKKSQLLEEYSVAQASLEQIFNHLAATTQQKRAREENGANISRTFSSHISDAAAPLISAQDE
jgi:ABC-type multidrug transport system ATPase subunit